jgi:hypothetical protein
MSSPQLADYSACVYRSQIFQASMFQVLLIVVSQQPAGPPLRIATSRHLANASSIEDLAGAAGIKAPWQKQMLHTWSNYRLAHVRSMKKSRSPAGTL